MVNPTNSPLRPVILWTTCLSTISALQPCLCQHSRNQSSQNNIEPMFDAKFLRTFKYMSPSFGFKLLCIQRLQRPKFHTYPVTSHEGRIKFYPDQQATNNVLAPQPSTCWKGRATRKLHLLFEAGGQAAQGNKAVQMEPIGLESGYRNVKNTTWWLQQNVLGNKNSYGSSKTIRWERKMNETRLLELGFETMHFVLKRQFL